jgi:hypothetical protein
LNVPLPVEVAPGASRYSCATWRPFSGSASTSRFGTVALDERRVRGHGDRLDEKARLEVEMTLFAPMSRRCALAVVCSSWNRVDMQDQ